MIIDKIAFSSFQQWTVNTRCNIFKSSRRFVHPIMKKAATRCLTSSRTAWQQTTRQWFISRILCSMLTSLRWLLSITRIQCQPNADHFCWGLWCIGILWFSVDVADAEKSLFVLKNSKKKIVFLFMEKRQQMQVTVSIINSRTEHNMIHSFLLLNYYLNEYYLRFRTT